MRALRSARAIRLLLPVAVLALLAGCSDAVDDPGPADPDALRWEDPDVDLAGVDLAVGSKEPAAQRVLGWLAVESLRAAGADVTDQINLGGTGANREALLAGLIDLYWEYPAVGWTSILQRTDPETDPEALVEDVRERDLEENAVAWLEPAPAELGYGLVTAAETAEEQGFETVQDVADALEERPGQVTFCVDDSLAFASDPDGLERFREATGSEVLADELLALPVADLEVALQPGGFCSAAAVRLGEPLVAGDDVVVLEDDGAFLPLQPTIMVRDDVLADAPEVQDVLDPLAERVTTEVVRELAAEVEVGGQEPRAVARAWLVAEGLATQPEAEEGSG